VRRDIDHIKEPLALGGAAEKDDRSETCRTAIFAPPFLRKGPRVCAQTSFFSDAVGQVIDL